MAEEQMLGLFDGDANFLDELAGPSSTDIGGTAGPPTVQGMTQQPLQQQQGVPMSQGMMMSSQQMVAGTMGGGSSYHMGMGQQGMQPQQQQHPPGSQVAPAPTMMSGHHQQQYSSHQYGQQAVAAGHNPAAMMMHPQQQQQGQHLQSPHHPHAPPSQQPQQPFSPPAGGGMGGYPGNGGAGYPSMHHPQQQQQMNSMMSPNPTWNQNQSSPTQVNHPHGQYMMSPGGTQSMQPYSNQYPQQPGQMPHPYGSPVAKQQQQMGSAVGGPAANSPYNRAAGANAMHTTGITSPPVPNPHMVNPMQQAQQMQIRASGGYASAMPQQAVATASSQHNNPLMQTSVGGSSYNPAMDIPQNVHQHYHGGQTGSAAAANPQMAAAVASGINPQHYPSYPGQPQQQPPSVPTDPHAHTNQNPHHFASQQTSQPTSYHSPAPYQAMPQQQQPRLPISSTASSLSTTPSSLPNQPPSSSNQGMTQTPSATSQGSTYGQSSLQQLEQLVSPTGHSGTNPYQQLVQQQQQTSVSSPIVCSSMVSQANGGKQQTPIYSSSNFPTTTVASTVGTGAGGNNHSHSAITSHSQNQTMNPQHQHLPQMSSNQGMMTGANTSATGFPGTVPSSQSPVINNNPLSPNQPMLPPGATPPNPQISMLEAQLQQLMNMPQNQQVSQQMLDIQERLRILRSQHQLQMQQKQQQVQQQQHHHQAQQPMQANVQQQNVRMPMGKSAVRMQLQHHQQQQQMMSSQNTMGHAMAAPSSQPSPHMQAQPQPQQPMMMPPGQPMPPQHHQAAAAAGYGMRGPRPGLPPHMMGQQGVGVGAPQQSPASQQPQLPTPTVVQGQMQGVPPHGLAGPPSIPSPQKVQPFQSPSSTSQIEPASAGQQKPISKAPLVSIQPADSLTIDPAPSFPDSLQMTPPKLDGFPLPLLDQLTSGGDNKDRQTAAIMKQEATTVNNAAVMGHLVVSSNSIMPTTITEIAEAQEGQGVKPKRKRVRKTKAEQQQQKQQQLQLQQQQQQQQQQLQQPQDLLQQPPPQDLLQQQQVDQQLPQPDQQQAVGDQPPKEKKKRVRKPKEPKEPKEPKPPKEPKTPKEPKAPRKPRTPKEPKEPKEQKEPKEAKPKTPRVRKRKTKKDESLTPPVGTVTSDADSSTAVTDTSAVDTTAMDTSAMDVSTVSGQDASSDTSMTVDTTMASTTTQEEQSATVDTQTGDQPALEEKPKSQRTKKPRAPKTLKLKPRKKKPPATLVLKTKKRKRGNSGSDAEVDLGEADTSIDGADPSSLEKRRSTRNTKRTKYVDDIDLNLSDDENKTANDTSEAPVTLKKETEEDTLIVDKVLGERIRTIEPEAPVKEENSEEKDSAESGVKQEVKEEVKKEDVVKSKGKEKPVEEFYVKYKNYSYLHCEWKTLEELEKGDKRVLGKIKRYRIKKSQSYFEVDDDDLFNPDYVEVDRVLDLAVTSNTDDAGETKDTNNYLVKWRALPYEDATWELEQDVDPAKIEMFMRFKEVPAEEDRKQFARPRPGQWKKLDESPNYKNDNCLREYQLEGVNWLTFCWYNGQNCILADEMGLGKTVQSITFLKEIHNFGIKGPYLVIVPLSTIGNWQREFETWTDMNVVVFHGTTLSRNMIKEYELFYKDENNQRIPDIYRFEALITTFEIILTDVDLFADIEWRCCVIDEAHRLKNKNCRLLEGLRLLDLEHRVLLTGTPLQNNTEELYSLLNFLSPAKFNSSDSFIKQFGDLKTEEQVDSLKEILKPMMLRRLKEDVEKNLAPKEETIIEVELTNIQKKYYRAILERNFQFLAKGSGSSIPSLMNAMMELRKCCNHPYLINGAEDNILDEARERKPDDPEMMLNAMVQSSGKMVLMDKLLPRLKSSGHKVLIFSQMIRVLDIIEDYLINKKYLYERLDGRIRGTVRQEAIDRFSKPDSDRFAFLLCTRAGGLGINLTAADTVVIYDSDWNPQNDLQAQARCHRIGQSKAVKVYRLITRNSYEREMFDKASLKLGLDKAVLQSMGGEKIVNSNQLTKKEIEDLLKKGAYGSLMEDDNTGDTFCEEDIDQILQRRTKVIQIESEGKGSTFAKASFSMSENRDDIDINDPEFWQKWAKKADIDTDLDKKKNDMLIIAEPRQRKQTTRYGNDEAITEMSELDTSSDTEDENGVKTGKSSRSKKGNRGGKNEDDGDYGDIPIGEKYLRSECFKVEKLLLVYGWGRWGDLLKHGHFKRNLREQDVNMIARAVLAHSLKFYKGDDKIKEFIWDLISSGKEGELKNHCGLSAPVPRGRKGKKKRENPFGEDRVLDFDPDVVLDQGYKRHLHRHSNKVLLRVRMLYYIKTELIGEEADKVYSNIPYTEIHIPQPFLETDLPVPWWDEDADKSLIIGVFKYGYEKFNCMRSDPALCFLSRCGPPDGAALLAEQTDERDEDDKDEEITKDEVVADDECSQSSINVPESGEATPITENGTPATPTTSETGEDKKEDADASSTPSETTGKDKVADDDKMAQDIKVKKGGLSETTKMDEGEEASVATSGMTEVTADGEEKSKEDGLEEAETDKLPFPDASGLNTRLRKVITSFQRHYKKRMLKNEQIQRRMERRGERIADFNGKEREFKRKPEIKQQTRWTRREEADFYRTVSTFGVEFSRTAGRFRWDRFREQARLDKKHDDSLTDYFHAFYFMCQRVCNKIKPNDAQPPNMIFVEPITEERASRCLARIDLLNKIRQDILMHPKLEDRLKACQPSYDMPSWWICGQHDKELLIGAARHGVAKTDFNILRDKTLSFHLVLENSLRNLRGQGAPMTPVQGPRNDPLSTSTPIPKYDLAPALDEVKAEDKEESEDIKPDLAVNGDVKMEEGEVEEKVKKEVLPSSSSVKEEVVVNGKEEEEVPAKEKEEEKGMKDEKKSEKENDEQSGKAKSDKEDGVEQPMEGVEEQNGIKEESEGAKSPCADEGKEGEDVKMPEEEEEKAEKGEGNETNVVEKQGLKDQDSEKDPYCNGDLESEKDTPVQGEKCPAKNSEDQDSKEETKSEKETDQKEEKTSENGRVEEDMNEDTVDEEMPTLEPLETEESVPAVKTCVKEDGDQEEAVMDLKEDKDGKDDGEEDVKKIKTEEKAEEKVNVEVAQKLRERVATTEENSQRDTATPDDEHDDRPDYVKLKEKIIKTEIERINEERLKREREAKSLADSPFVGGPPGVFGDDPSQIDIEGLEPGEIAPTRYFGPAVEWPKDRVIFHRLEHICYTIENGEWPFTRRAPNPFYSTQGGAPHTYESRSETPLSNLMKSDSATGATDSDHSEGVPHNNAGGSSDQQAPVLQVMKLGSSYSGVVGTSGDSDLDCPPIGMERMDGLQRLVHKNAGRGRGRRRYEIDPDQANRIQQLLNQSAAGTLSSDNESQSELLPPPTSTPSSRSMTSTPPHTPQQQRHLPSPQMAKSSTPSSRSSRHHLMPSPLLNGSASASDLEQQIQRKMMMEQGLFIPERKKRGRKRRSEKLAEMELAEAMAKQEQARVISMLDSDVRIPVINLEYGNILTGDNAPRKRDLETWLLKHPSYIVDNSVCLLDPFIGGSSRRKSSTSAAHSSSSSKNDERRGRESIDSSHGGSSSGHHHHHHRSSNASPHLMTSSSSSSSRRGGGERHQDEEEVNPQFVLNTPEIRPQEKFARKRGRKPQLDPRTLDLDRLTGDENVAVVERGTGKKITGAKAPPLRHLKEWLDQNASFDVEQKWGDLVKAKGVLPKSMDHRILKPSGRGRKPRDPTSLLQAQNLLSASTGDVPGFPGVSMAALSAAGFPSGLMGKFPNLPMGLPFGGIPGLPGLANPLLGLQGLQGLQGLGMQGLAGFPPHLAKAMEEELKEREKELKEKEKELKAAMEMAAGVGGGASSKDKDEDNDGEDAGSGSSSKNDEGGKDGSGSSKRSSDDVGSSSLADSPHPSFPSFYFNPMMYNPALLAAAAASGSLPNFSLPTSLASMLPPGLLPTTLNGDMEDELTNNSSQSTSSSSKHRDHHNQSSSSSSSSHQHSERKRRHHHDSHHHRQHDSSHHQQHHRSSSSSSSSQHHHSHHSNNPKSDLPQSASKSSSSHAIEDLSVKRSRLSSSSSPVSPSSQAQDLSVKRHSSRSHEHSSSSSSRHDRHDRRTSSSTRDNQEEACDLSMKPKLKSKPESSSSSSSSSKSGSNSSSSALPSSSSSNLKVPNKNKIMGSLKLNKILDSLKDRVMKIDNPKDKTPSESGNNGDGGSSSTSDKASADSNEPKTAEDKSVDDAAGEDQQCSSSPKDEGSSVDPPAKEEESKE